MKRVITQLTVASAVMIGMLNAQDLSAFAEEPRFLQTSGSGMAPPLGTVSIGAINLKSK